MTVKLIAENILDSDHFLSATEQEGEYWKQPQPANDNAGTFRLSVMGTPSQFSYTGAATSNGEADGTTVVDSKLRAFGDNYFIGATVTMTSGTCNGESKSVTDFTQATGTLTTAAFSAQIDSGDTFTLSVAYASRSFLVGLEASGDTGDATFKWSHDGGTTYFGRDEPDAETWDGQITIDTDAEDAQPSRPTILVRDDGTWVCFYIENAGNWAMRTSADYGVTWSDETVLNVANVTAMQQGSVIILRNGRWLIVSSYIGGGTTAYIYYSDDEGVTWNSLVTTTHRLGALCELFDGRIVSVHHSAASTLVSQTSSDCGSSWADAVSISADGQYPVIVQAENGHLVCAYESDVDSAGDYEIKAKLSTDNGATWGAELDVLDFDATHEYRYPSIVRDITGKIFILAVNTYGAGPWNIVKSVSSDNGATWSAAQTIASPVEVPGILGAALLDGHILVCLWVDSGNDLDFVRAGYWEAYSANGCPCAPYAINQNLICGASIIWFGGSGVLYDDWSFTAEYNYAMANMIEDSPSKPWRSTQDNTACFIVLDMGAAARFYADGVAFFGCNLRTLTFEMNDTNSWGAPSVTEAVSFDLVTGSVETPEVDDETGASWGPTVHGLSLADGVAYFKASGVDLSGYAGTEGTSTPYGIIIHDSAAKVVKSYIGAADAAEALSGSELILNPGFETVTGTDDDGTSDNFDDWTEVTDDVNGSKVESVTASKHGDARSVKLTRGTTAPSIRQTANVTEGKLYKVSFWTRGSSGVAGRYQIYNAVGDIIALATTGVTADDWTQVSRYITGAVGGTYIGIRLYPGSSPGNIAYFDDVSIQEVTHIGATGVHIVDTKDSSDRNWTSIEAGFNYNDSAYTFEVYRVPVNEIGAATVLASYKDHELAGCYLRFTSGTQSGNTFEILDNVNGYLLLDAASALSTAWDADTFAIFQGHVAKTFTGGVYRYMRISIGAQHTAEDYYQIGSTVVGRTITLTDAFDTDYGKAHLYNVELLRTPSGGIIQVTGANRKRKFDLRWTCSDAGRKQMLALLDYIQGKNICLIPDSAALTDVYLVKRISDVEQEHWKGEYFHMEAEFEEVL